RRTFGGLSEVLTFTFVDWRLEHEPLSDGIESRNHRVHSDIAGRRQVPARFDFAGRRGGDTRSFASTRWSMDGGTGKRRDGRSARNPTAFPRCRGKIFAGARR